MSESGNGKRFSFIKELEEEDSFNVSAWGARHSQCLILFFTLTIAYSMRACMGVALVGMVDSISNKTVSNISEFSVNNTFLNETEYGYLGNETLDDLNSTIGIEEDVEEFEVHGFLNALLITAPYPKFTWPKKVQDMVLSAFFWGYMVLQIPAGQLAHRFGARYLLVAALTGNCLISLFFPLGCYYGGWVCALIFRIGQGLSQACIVPSIHTVLGKWSTVEERGRMGGVINGGQAIGTVLGLPITGFIASSPTGWPGIFRFYGVLSGIIAVALWFQLSDTPAKHKRISPGERRYIEEALGQTGSKATLPVPWKKILSSRGMTAIVAAHIANTWGTVILFSQVPAYMDKMMGVNIKANGMLSALPFLVMWITNFFFCWIFDMLIVKKYMDVTKTRKLATSVGYIPAALGFIALGFAPKNIYIVESILVLICAFKVASHTGFYVNHVDIAPNYAGTMMSISNFVSNAIAAQAPMVAGAIITDVTDATQWRIVFAVSGLIYLITNMVYLLMGTGEEAEWNHPPTSPSYEKVALNDLPQYRELMNFSEHTHENKTMKEDSRDVKY